MNDRDRGDEHKKSKELVGICSEMGNDLMHGVGCESDENDTDREEFETEQEGRDEVRLWSECFATNVRIGSQSMVG